MKILFINQFFWPDSSATSQQLTDLANGLAARGHKVSILCGSGGYAKAASSEAPAGVKIFRVRDFAFARGRFGRLLSYISFYPGALLRGLTIERQDLVVSLTTPPLISVVGSIIQALRGSRHSIYEQDLYPDIAVDLGYLKPNSVVVKIAGVLSDLARRRADGVIALGECMRLRLMGHGVPSEKISIADHWASSTAITPSGRPGDPSELVLLYSGNLGMAHDIHTFTIAIFHLRHDKRFRFLFVGGGSHREELVNFCESNDIRSVELRPYVDRDLLSEGLAVGDIGVVTQHHKSCGAIVPSKVYGILAAGRPVLFIGPSNATPALIIARHGCGWQIDCNDDASLAKLLLYLADKPHVVREAGARAREALLNHYDLPIGIDHLESIFTMQAGVGLRGELSSRTSEPLLLSPRRVVK